LICIDGSESSFKAYHSAISIINTEKDLVIGLYVKANTAVDKVESKFKETLDQHKVKG
jgi:hypothetical protein